MFLAELSTSGPSSALQDVAPVAPMAQHSADELIAPQCEPLRRKRKKKRSGHVRAFHTGSTNESSPRPARPTGRKKRPEAFFAARSALASSSSPVEERGSPNKSPKKPIALSDFLESLKSPQQPPAPSSPAASSNPHARSEPCFIKVEACERTRTSPNAKGVARGHGNHGRPVASFFSPVEDRPRRQVQTPKFAEVETSPVSRNKSRRRLQDGSPLAGLASVSDLSPHVAAQPGDAWLGELGSSAYVQGHGSPEQRSPRAFAAFLREGETSSPTFGRGRPIQVGGGSVGPLGGPTVAQRRSIFEPSGSPRNASISSAPAFTMRGSPARAASAGNAKPPLKTIETGRM